MRIAILALLLALCGPALEAQVVGKPTKGAFLLRNATIETVTNGTVSGDLLIEDGKITGLGANLSAPTGARTIDCSGKFVYPGFIDAGTSLGTVEINSVSLTRDNNEIGEINPHMKALTAVNPNSVAIPVTRVSGVTTVITKPSGGLIPGTASLINLIGYSPAEMHAGFDAMVMNFPSSGPSRRDRRSPEDRQKEEAKKLKQITELWDDTRLFARIGEAKAKDKSVRQEYNPTLSAMIPVVNGEMPLFIEVNREKDILSALSWIKEHPGVKSVLTGVAEGWRVADSIAAAGVPVITGPVINLPTRASDRYDRPYANAGLLHKAGVTVAIRSDDTENVRDLPFHAGFAAAYGLGRAEALRAITIVPAQIMGVADELGSLEVGKTANLFICDGDPFETKTQVEQVFIQGWEVPMNSRQSLLYDEFLERRPGVRN